MVWDDIKGSKVLAMGIRQKSNGLYKLTSKPQVSIAETEDKAKLWHKRYGHLHYRGLIHIFKNGRVWGMLELQSYHEVYRRCHVGWHARERLFKKSTHKAKQVLELIHSNLVDPLSKASLNKSRYFVVVIDDYIRKSWVYFMQEKSETSDKFKDFKSFVEAETWKEYCRWGRIRGEK
jgi:hypothetical protein